MKTLNNLREYILKSKTWIDCVGIECNGLRSYVYDFATDAKTSTVYLYCDPDRTPLTVKEILAASYRYPNLALYVYSEDPECYGSVKGFTVSGGDPNFGEPNLLELY